MDGFADSALIASLPRGLPRPPARQIEPSPWFEPMRLLLAVAPAALTPRHPAHRWQNLRPMHPAPWAARCPTPCPPTRRSPSRAKQARSPDASAARQHSRLGPALCSAARASSAADRAHAPHRQRPVLRIGAELPSAWLVHHWASPAARSIALLRPLPEHAARSKTGRTRSTVPSAPLPAPDTPPARTAAALRPGHRQ